MKRAPGRLRPIRRCGRPDCAPRARFRARNDILHMGMECAVCPRSTAPITALYKIAQLSVVLNGLVASWTKALGRSAAGRADDADDATLMPEIEAAVADSFWSVAPSEDRALARQMSFEQVLCEWMFSNTGPRDWRKLTLGIGLYAEETSVDLDAALREIVDQCADDAAGLAFCKLWDCAPQAQFRVVGDRLEGRVRCSHCGKTGKVVTARMGGRMAGSLQARAQSAWSALLGKHAADL